jgi:hypothetical protein
MDDVITSCKHTFHPFCLSAMLKYLNKCCVCNVTLHPNWWTSWGFRELDEKLTKLANRMNLEQIQEDTMRKTREATKSRLDLKL